MNQVSLINNYGFDSANFFTQIDYRNQSQIDFELLQQFFRRNGQEISLQDYQILLTRLKRNKQQENEYITRQEFIQIISPQLPYRGKNWMGQSVMYQSQVGGQKSVSNTNEKTVRFQDQSLVQSEHNGNVLIQSRQQELQDQSQTLRQGLSSHRVLQNQFQTDTSKQSGIPHNQQSILSRSNLNQQQQFEDPRVNQLIQDQSQHQIGQSSIQQAYLPPNHAAEYPPVQQFYQAGQSLAYSQIPINQGQQPVIQGSNVLHGNPQGIFMSPPGQLPPPAPPGYVLVQHPPQPMMLQNHPSGIYSPQSLVMQQPIYQSQEEPLNRQNFQQVRQESQENVNSQRYINDKRPNAVLEAMNEILKKDNEKLKKDNQDLMLKMVQFQQSQIRENQEQKRQDDVRKKQEEEILKKQREYEQKRQREVEEEEQRKNEQQQQRFIPQQVNRIGQYPSQFTLNSPKVLSHSIAPQFVPSTVQSQLIVSPPMSPIRLVPHVQQSDNRQREEQIVQQLIQPQIQAPHYILEPNQVPHFVVNNHPFGANQSPSMNYNQSQFAPHLIPKYNPQNLEIREAINQQFAPPQPFIQQGSQIQAKSQPIHDPYTSHYPNRLNY